MKIAIPVIENNGEKSRISEHFGHSPYFAFVELKENKKFTFEIVENPLENHSPGEIPDYMLSKNVDLMVVRGIGDRAINAFDSLGIQVIRGADGTLKEIIEKYISFYTARGHKQIPNVSLIPEGDPTLLFVNSGMFPLVPYLSGEAHPLGKRLVNVQRSLKI